MNNFKVEELKLIAGIDLAYWEGPAGSTYAVCSVVIVDFDTKEVVERQSAMGEIKVPYIPGKLAFRELPLIKETISKLQSKVDLFMFDGNGYLHENNMGVATHGGLEPEFGGVATIGVAKTYYKVTGEDFIMPENEAGAYTLIQKDGITYGAAVRSRKDVKPIFVSCGNNIDLETSIEVTLALVTKESRLPVTTRFADLETHTQRSLIKGGY